MVSVVVKFWVSGALLWFWWWSPPVSAVPSYELLMRVEWQQHSLTLTDWQRCVCGGFPTQYWSLCLQPLSLVRTCCWLVMESEACFNARECDGRWPPDVINENKYMYSILYVYINKTCVSAPFTYYSQTLAGESIYRQLLRWVSGRGKPMTSDNLFSVCDWPLEM